ncbi:MAG: hypothetical protein IT227_13335 [Flavobacteriales bacterium]|nr:hypothetical protein [Flavobacteriales bacterium]
MNKSISPVLLLATLLGSCSEPRPDGGGQEAPTHTTQDSAHTKATDALPLVSLNNGQRWKANPETTSGIANMVGILGAYEPASGDPAALKAALEEEFGLIFERCTMEGEAHEQLHNYLLPIHHQLRDFTATEEQHAALSAHLAAYGDHFE